jgi:predicted house-cleaning noncanonical NTP pyrophosphatase (MazG superfamily)
MERVEIISNFLNELNDKIQKEIEQFPELEYEEQLQLAYSAIDRIVEHINDILEKIDSEDKKELLEFLIKQNNEFLAIKFSHILPLSEVIALYFAKSRILKEIMQYYVEALNYMLEK